MRFSHPLIIYNCLRYSSFLFCNCFLDFLYFNPFIYVYIYIFHAFKPHCYFSILYHICFSSDIFDYPIHCHHINHILSLCFSISSSSNTPLSIALQAEDERTLLVMVEQRRSPDALDRPSPFISLVPDAV